jgi:hypothetical protein
MLVHTVKCFNHGECELHLESVRPCEVTVENESSELFCAKYVGIQRHWVAPVTLHAIQNVIILTEYVPMWTNCVAPVTLQTCCNVTAI